MGRTTIPSNLEPVDLVSSDSTSIPEVSSNPDTSDNIVKDIKKKPANAVPMKQLTIPRGAPGEENFIIIGVNGKNWKIRKGETVTVPYYVKDAYDNSMKAARTADNYREQIFNKNQ